MALPKTVNCLLSRIFLLNGSWISFVNSQRSHNTFKTLKSYTQHMVPAITENSALAHFT